MERRRIGLRERGKLVNRRGAEDAENLAEEKFGLATDPDKGKGAKFVCDHEQVIVEYFAIFMESAFDPLSGPPYLD